MVYFYPVTCVGVGGVGSFFGAVGVSCGAKDVACEWAVFEWFENGDGFWLVSDFHDEVSVEFYNHEFSVAVVIDVDFGVQW